MSETEKVDPIEETKRIDEQFQNDPMCGGITFNGLVGYHTYFDRSRGLRFAAETALHAALDEALMEVALDADMIEEVHGEFTPATATQELREQLTEFYDLSPHSYFVELLTEKFKERLESMESQL